MAIWYAVWRWSALSSLSPLKSCFSRAFSKSSWKTTHNNWKENEAYLPPDPMVRSWVPPRDPVEAKWRLKRLNIQYHKKIKEIRKQFIHELEEQRVVKENRVAIDIAAARVAKKQRDVEKAAVLKVKAAERKIVDEEFRKVIKKEREERLERWRIFQEYKREREAEKKDGIRRESSSWIDEGELEKKILEAVVDTTPL